MAVNCPIMADNLRQYSVRVCACMSERIRYWDGERQRLRERDI